MQIALLLSANPKKSAGGSFVQIPSGLWAIEFVGVTDSQFTIERLTTHGPTPVDHGEKIEGGYYRVAFLNRGQEPSVSIFAKSLPT